jgi:hypothetical protein
MSRYLLVILAGLSVLVFTAPLPAQPVRLPNGQVLADVTLAQEKPDLAERVGSLSATLIASMKGDAEITDALFLAILIRAPKDHEKKNIKKVFERSAKRHDAVEELLWVLVKSGEFMELHRLTDLTPEQLRQFAERVTKAMHKK